MNQQEQDRWASDLLAKTLGIAWHDSDPQARRIADAAARYVADLNQDNKALLGLVLQIREAAGDPTGKLMQPELVAHICEMRAVLEQIRADLRRTDGGFSTDTLGRLQAVIVATGGAS